MKALITLILVLFFGTLAVAQDTPSTVSIKAGVKTETPREIVVPAQSVKEVPGDDAKAVARLYRYRNYRVQKELNFTTKKNKAKLA